MIVTWDAVAGAAYYRVGYVSETEFYAVTGAGRDWTEAYYFVDVKNTGQTEFTLKGLEPGVLHLFIVAGNASQYGEPEWDFTQIAQLTLQSTAPGDYDVDNDGLIEISSLAQLDAMRYDTDGDGSVSDEDYVAYTQAFTDARSDMGCPSDGCRGYELMADLDFDTNGNGRADAGDAYWNDGKGWEPIGDFDHPFTTTFDGNSHTISNLHVNRPTENVVGLFGRAYFGNVVRNVTLASVDVTGDANVGGLIGLIWGGTISDSSISGGSVTGTGNVVGGLVGIHREGGVITNSNSTATVSGKQAVGGLAGVIYGTSIIGSHATGEVTSTESTAGGLVADSLFGTVISSYATGDISGGGARVGGLVGFNRYSMVVAGYAVGDVSGGGNDVGGLTGSNLQGIIRSTYAKGSVVGAGSGDDNIGGLVGDNIYGYIGEGYATGSVSSTGGGTDKVGGLVGESDANSRIIDSYSRGSVSGSSGAQVGGLVGENSGSVDYSYWDTQASSITTSAGGEGKTTAELQTPTDNTGIYEDWSSGGWDFGTASQYPVLHRFDLDPAAQR